MNRTVAESIISSTMKLTKGFNEVCESIERISDDDERKVFRKKIADAMASVYADIMVPIIREHPDLDPDKMADNSG